MTDEDKARFHTALSVAKTDSMMETPGGEMPMIEAPLRMVEHLNRGKMEGVEKAGYFVFDGVKVCIEGRREYAEKRDRLTTEDVMHPPK